MALDRKRVWVVSYYDECEEEPVVTVFDNERAATKCYSYLITQGVHTKVCVDEAPVYQSFTYV